MSLLMGQVSVRRLPPARSLSTRDAANRPKLAVTTTLAPKPAHDSPCGPLASPVSQACACGYTSGSVEYTQGTPSLRPGSRLKP